MKLTYRVVTTFAAALLVIACARTTSAQGPKNPDIAEFERALDHRLQGLRPEGTTERNVRFIAALAGKPTGSSFPFRATLVIRDYGPGYPRNRYYGETCVGQLNEVVYTMEPDAFGGWNVQGQMVPDLAQKVCKENPSEGASSQPVDALSGSPAPAASTTPAPPAPGGAGPGTSAGRAQPAGSMATGPYLCWANGEAREFMNFTVTGPGAYVGTDGKRGTFALDANSHVTFHGGAMDGALPDGFFALYHAPQGRPTLSIQSPRGAEAVFCQR
jgi:hypothetical protein